MKLKLITIFSLLIFVSASCPTHAFAAKPKKANIQRYFVSLNGDGSKQCVEVEAITLPAPLTEVRIRNNKKSEVIDSFSVLGKLRTINFTDFNFDQRDRIVVLYDDENDTSNIAVYQLGNNKLSKIFFASSAYGIEPDFTTASRIKIGKSPKTGPDNPNLIPEWDVWIWCGDRFIKE